MRKLIWHRYIRYAEITVILVLAVFAWLTWRELNQLRQLPVALPNYVFDISGGADSGAVIQTRGTWIAESGRPEPLQTTTIECRKATMRCVESDAAIVFVSGKGLLESTISEFEIEHWSDKEVVAKPRADRCATRTLALDLVDKRARSRVAVNRDSDKCKEAPDRTLELVAGYRFREQPTDKSARL